MRYIFSKVGNTLHKMHKAGFAHRNFKPESIMVTKDLDFKVTNFEHATSLSGSGGNGFDYLTSGTHMYMAPEIGGGNLYQG